MSLILGAMGKQQSIAEKNELQYKMSLIRTAIKTLATSRDGLMNAGTDLDPENPAVKQLEQRKERLALLEKKLNMQLAEYEDRLKMVEADEKNYEAMFKSGLESTFSGK